ncbi:hypothetical protein HYV50_00685 [Candidatus Pacearchaeota archaeon]|nr:hypothetical protein [Candidatus Pacearchaeota archaeon]
MNTQQVIIVLLVIAIIFSVVSIVLNLWMNSSFIPLEVGVRREVRNINTIVDNAGPSEGNVGVTIVGGGA